MREYEPRRRDGSGTELRRGLYGEAAPDYGFAQPLQRDWDSSGVAFRERLRTPGHGLVPSAGVHHHHSYGGYHDGYRHSRPRSRLSISFSFGSYWGYPHWYYRPSYWHYYDPWYPPVVYYRPYRPWHWWDCDPWPVRSTVVISTGFAFSSSASVRYVYSSSALVPAAVVHEPVYVAPIIYSPPPVAPVLLSSQPAAVAESYPEAASEAQLRTVTDRQLADTYLRLGDLESAIRVYASHTSRHPGDAQALRSLGIALIADEQVRTGAEYVQRAYRVDPLLAQRPIARDLVDQRMFDFVLDLSTRAAAEQNSAALWLTVASLMQSQGRYESARTAVERARTAGLDSAIVEWMLAETPAAPRP
jgi:tetratricopeptide (TPR) repeat protein